MVSDSNSGVLSVIEWQYRVDPFLRLFFCWWQCTFLNFCFVCEDCCLSPLLSNDILSDRLDMKVMIKIRSWERFYYQISYEQDQVVVSGPNGRAEWRLLRWVQSWVYLCQRVVFESCAYRGNDAAFCLTDMVESVQHKEILRRHMPEALRLAVAKNIENRLFSQATSPILCGPMSIRVKFPDVFLSYVLSAVLC